MPDGATRWDPAGWVPMWVFRRRGRAGRWRVEQAVEVLRRFASERAVDVEVCGPAELVALMTSWYETDAPRGVLDLDDEGDGLLFEWGTFSFDRREFWYSITRQFVTSEDDETMWQLSASLRYAPSDASDALGDGTRWCFSPVDLHEFRGFIESAPATSFACSEQPVRRELVLYRV